VVRPWVVPHRGDDAPAPPLGTRELRPHPGVGSRGASISGAEAIGPEAKETDLENARAAREHSWEIERRLLGYLEVGRAVQVQTGRSIPPGFQRNLRRSADNEELPPAVLEYYRNEMTRRDSTNILGLPGQPSPVDQILRGGGLGKKRKEISGPGWRPVKLLGKGGQGDVTLWEKRSTNGAVNYDLFNLMCSDDADVWLSHS